MTVQNKTKTSRTNLNLIAKGHFWTKNCALITFCVNSRLRIQTKFFFFLKMRRIFQRHYIFISTKCSKLMYISAVVMTFSPSQLHSENFNTWRYVNLSENVNVAWLSSDRMYPFQFQFSEYNFWRKGVSVNRYS